MTVVLTDTQLLTAAFQELSILRKNKNAGNTVFLADDETREMFASGLVEILDKDVYKPPLPSYRRAGRDTGNDRERDRKAGGGLRAGGSGGRW